MWHEARRQEKKIRGLMVDFKRRADRRREFYEKIKQDPTQFLRMYGRPLKIQLDPAVAMAAEGPQSMMPWQGDSSNMIDRFDVRANLDLIPEYIGNKFLENSTANEEDERLANYERYRTLVENEASGLTEEQCLHQIYLDEHFGTITKTNEEEKKKNADKKAAIGFVYEDSTPVEKKENVDAESEEESEDDLDTADLDVTIDVDTLTVQQAQEVNICASQYGMKDDDFVRLLRQDKEELEALKEARQLEEAKAQFSGRKSRRERRAINEKRHNPYRFNRPSYAARESPKYEPYKRPGSSSRSRSRSRSRSPETVKVKFITSFGNESDEERVVQGPTLPTSIQQANLKNSKSSKCETSWSSTQKSSQPKREIRRTRRSQSRSRSRSRSRRRRRSSSRSYSSRSRSSRSRSRSGSKARRYSPGYRRGSGRDRSWRSPRSNSRRRSSSSRSRSRSKSKSPTKSPQKRSRSKTPEPNPVIKRYRRESLSSNSGMSDVDSDDGENSNQSSISARAANDSTKLFSPSGGNLISKSLTQKSKETPQERLKRRMQAQINRQFKADKKAEISKISKQEQERLDREEEIRNLALEMRRREREKRHKEKEEEELTRRSRRDSKTAGNGSSSNTSGGSSSSSSRSRSRSSSEESLDRSHGSRTLKGSDRKVEERDRAWADGRNSDRDRGRGGRESDRRPEGRSSEMRMNMDSGDRRRRSGEDDWDGRRTGRRWEDTNHGGSREWRRDSQKSSYEERWDSERRDRQWDRDGRRNWRDRNDYDRGRNRDSGSSSMRSRPHPPPSSQYRERPPPLLHRPDSPVRSSRHLRN